MEELRAQLEDAIRCWGMNDIVTIMLSQRLDKLVNMEQKKELKRC